MRNATTDKPQKPSDDFPLFPHASKQWAKKINGKLKYFGPWSDPQGALDRYLGKAKTHGENIARGDKPAKPSEDFPLFPHDSGQWAKKIKGKLHYFGPWSNDRKGDAAIKRYAEDRDDLLAGRVPQRRDGLQIDELVNRFLTAKQRLVDGGERSRRTLQDYKDVCAKIVEVFGKHRHVSTLRPSDFEKLRAEFAKTHGPVRLGKDVSCTRSVFDYGFESDLMERPVKFGPEFKRPSRLVLRKHRQKQQPKMFEAAEIRAMIAKAKPQLRAMIYLGINAALGNADCAALTMKCLDLDAGWLNFPRPKTGVARRCPLWPETVKAIKAALAKRPTPKDDGHTDRVFLTKYGFPWISKGKHGSDNPISKETAKILRELGINRTGVGFYALRHTLATIGQRTRDVQAVRAIMGHVEDASDMLATNYTEEAVSDDRLKAVTDHVRKWLKRT